ncbi:N-acyl-phosphatidylethanolamine-hydrolyzing phospholipase D [Collybia nuda]|uniref:N-acyl-phosphatidylethanolamine-hydrolyzing phospholipase D n=1 Tax=Collybia nuda TaxID=64659 RepID=A0A9P5YB14_9AGAR|nr:N-acyl-phosphatidylethanolamine-hydrolyzing phospholipase D [Collybia nuda]
MRVFEIAGKQQRKGKPDHWVDSDGSAFQNPWPSWRTNGMSDRLSVFSKDMRRQIPIRQPTWGLSAQTEEATKDKIKATWLGHACFLVELPSRWDSVGRGARVLFDPVFSDRCSPSQWIGPKRFTPPPCKIEDMPEIDAVVISHNHYDHLDTHTIRTLSQRTRIPHFFAPLGNGYFFQSMGIPSSHIHIMDWWDTKRVELSASSEKHVPKHAVAVDITCTPAQHFTGRSLLDGYKTLWSSWVVEEVRPPAKNPPPSDESGVKLFFAGDTGYRTVLDGQDEDKVPVCPAFTEIGAKFGSFDLALIPIGAYMPRQFMSSIHCAPQDSVRIFKDVGARKALGMHWGTWVLTTEDVNEPPRRLAEECEKAGIETGAFGVCEIGETVLY